MKKYVKVMMIAGAVLAVCTPQFLSALKFKNPSDAPRENPSVLAQSPGAPDSGDMVVVSFTYTPQKGFASNQFAVWIEDMRGRHVRTLFATRFTAAGGWQRRELSLAQWVKQSNLKDMNRQQVDAISGPTPRGGALRYTWNGLDTSGAAAPAGEYRVFVEATLRNENQALYSAVIRLGQRGQTVTAQVKYAGTSAAERGMIGPVTVSY